jgi:hypothetical protein
MNKPEYTPIVAGDVIPPPKKINSLQAIMKLKPIRDSEWCVYAYVLNRDLLHEDGTLDDLRAMIFPLGSFKKREKAEAHAKYVIETTGHPAVVVAKYGVPIAISENFTGNTVEKVTVDEKGKIMQLEDEEYRKTREEYEAKIKRDRELEVEAEQETDPDSIEHFKRQCYLAIKNKAVHAVKAHETKEALEQYEIRKEKVRDHYVRYPEHEQDWLPYLKEKLEERGEGELYRKIELGYKDLRSELLGL